MLPFISTPNPFWKTYSATPLPYATGVSDFFATLLVPSFLFASGILAALNYERKQHARTTIILNRAKRLLIPWLLMALLRMAPLYTLFDLTAFNRPAGTSFFETPYLALSGRFVDHLWFLLVLFWAALFWTLCMPLVKRRLWLGAALALAAAFTVE